MNADYILIRNAKGGDSEAAEAIIRKYYADIFNYCKYHTTDIHTAEDLTQETFFTFFKNLQNYRHYGKLLNYLYTIAGNKCIDENRKKRNTEVGYEGVFNELNLAVSDFTDEGEDEFVEEAVNSLSIELREVIVLFYFLDKKQKDIAKICDISLPLVKYRLKKGKEKIKEYLEGGAYS